MQFPRNYSAEQSRERLTLESRGWYTFCACFSFAVFFYFSSRLFAPGYLERLKEQLNGVKAVRVPVALSRLIAVAFFSPFGALALLAPPENIL